MSDLNNPIFQDDAKAREWLEARIWPEGPVCPHCGSLEREITKLEGKAHRAGLFQCNACREQFTATVGTVFERSKIPLSKWLLALYLLTASKKGMSTHQMHRMLGVSYKSTWFMTHRLREAMRDGTLKGPLGGPAKVVEVDETYVGGKESNKHKVKRTRGRRGGVGKQAVVALIDRKGGMRSFHVPVVNAKSLRPILSTHIQSGSFLMTDDASLYAGLGKEFGGHATVNHSAEEYVRDGYWHTNTVENYFSILKRGINGIYQQVSQQHLKRYLCEFDFRYNNRDLTDMDRTKLAAQGIVGKRLTYRRSDHKAAALAAPPQE